MKPSLEFGHPICSLFFLLREKPTDDFVRSFERMLESVSSMRPWVIDPPVLLDYIDETVDPSGKTFDSYEYGAVLKFYSALPPWNTKLPFEIDKLHYEEVKLMIDEVCRVSREANVDFRLQMDRTPIGSIQHGIPDESIQRGLLEEWRRVVESPSHTKL